MPRKEKRVREGGREGGRAGGRGGGSERKSEGEEDREGGRGRRLNSQSGCRRRRMNGKGFIYTDKRNEKEVNNMP